MTPGELHVWPLALAELPETLLPPASAAELHRAASFRCEELRRAHLLAHRALRAILQTVTRAPLDFAVAAHGKPFLPAAPDVQFNLSHSGEMALVAVAMDTAVGADIERIRPLSDADALAERYFPASEASAWAALPAAERPQEFFRRWTRIEAALKARGIGLLGLGTELDGNWTVTEIAVPAAYAAAVAAPRAAMPVRLHRFGET